MAKDASQYLKCWGEGSNVVVSNCLGRFGVPLSVSPRPHMLCCNCTIVEARSLTFFQPPHFTWVSLRSLSLCRYVCPCVSLCVILPNRFYPSQNTKPFCVLVPANSLHSCPFTPYLHTPWVTGTGSLVWRLCPCFSCIRSQALEGLSWLGIAWNSLRRMEWEIQRSFSRDSVAKGRAASKAQSTMDAGHGAFSSTERGEDPRNKNAFTSSWKATASEKA